MSTAHLVQTATRRQNSRVYASAATRELFNLADPGGETEHAFCPSLARSLLDMIPPDGLILDVGSGRRQKPPIPIGDDRLVSLDWAASALSDAANPVAADWTAIPLVDDSVTAVISECGLTLGGTTEGVLREIARIVTTPGGLLISVVAHSTDMAAQVDRFCELASRCDLVTIASEDTTDAWADKMVRRHVARRRAARRLRSQMPTIAEAALSVADAILEPTTGVVTTHHRRELLFASTRMR